MWWVMAQIFLASSTDRLCLFIVIAEFNSNTLAALNGDDRDYAKLMKQFCDILQFNADANQWIFPTGKFHFKFHLMHSLHSTKLYILQMCERFLWNVWIFTIHMLFVGFVRDMQFTNHAAYISAFNWWFECNANFLFFFSIVEWQLGGITNSDLIDSDFTGILTELDDLQVWETCDWSSNANEKNQL